MAQENTRKDYFDCVSAIAQEVIDEGKRNIGADGTFDDLRDWVCDEGMNYIHESVDGNWWVIYTHAAKLVLEYSDNDNAGFDEGLIDTAPWAQTGIDYSAVAFWAMRQDVADAVQDLLDNEAD